MLLVVLVHHSSADEPRLPIGAMAAVRTYSEAFSRGDCSTVMRLTSPALTSRLARDGAEAALCSFLQEMKKEGVAEVLGTTTPLHVDGRYRLALVSNRRTALQPSMPSAPSTDGTYAVHSDDDGATWYVLDLGCLDERWLKEIYPGYAGTPPIPRSPPVEPDMR